MDISVAIVEDNNDIRNALEQIIDMADGYKLAGSCVNGEEALAAIMEKPYHLNKKLRRAANRHKKAVN